MADRAYILCPFADRSSLYTSWLEDLPIPYTIERNPAVLWEPPPDARIVITHMHYRWEDISVLRRLQHEYPNLPVLVLADGILEYRNVWQHPDLAAGSMFQPLLAHKVACIGKGQTRILESWGNVGKCELVGMPRLDNQISNSKHQPAVTDKFRLLVATALTPAFDEAQFEIAQRSLSDLQQWLKENPVIAGRRIETTWRLTGGLDRTLGLSPLDVQSDGEEQRPPLMEVLNDVDAVITTPSTVYLESLLKGLPTAILDYHNSPAYVPPAWQISAQDHLGRVVAELADPPPPKMLFQETTLHDNLECRSPAVDRLLELIKTMVQCGRTARETGKPIEFPFRILTDPSRGFFPVLETFEIERLFPNAERFQNRDMQALQVELNAAVECLKYLPQQLADRESDLQKFKKLLDKSRARREKMFANMKDLQARFLKLKARLNKQ